MLLISNGAYKSGSTWLLRILMNMTGYAGPPPQFDRSNWAGRGVPPERLKQFLEQVDYANHDYLFKAHLFFKGHLVANRPNVRIVNITRDIRDVVVSAFYFAQLRKTFAGTDFDRFYWEKGRHIARWVIQYNRLWQKVPNACTLSYERLHQDFAGELQSLAAFVGIAIQPQDIERIRGQTELNSLRTQYDEVSADGTLQFYRKGIVGDWQNHLSEAVLADLRDVEHQERNYPSRWNLVMLRLRNLTEARNKD